MVLLRNFKNIFLVPELRKKIGVTLGIFAVFRFGSHIPVPGIDQIKLVHFINKAASGIMGYLNLMSGGALTRFSVFALGIGPYISASIMMQILTVVLPSLEQLQKEGEYGRNKINQYTRYLTLGLSVIQGLGLAVLAESQGLALHAGWGFRLTSILIFSTGSLFVMWLGEQITSCGIGNGSSMIIFSGIVAGLPSGIAKIVNDIRLGQFEPLFALLLLVISIAIVACVIFLEKGERKVPVHYAKRVVGNKIYGGQSSYIPLKINAANVIPVIFAGSTIAMPMMLVRYLSAKFPSLTPLAEWFVPGSILYMTLLAGLIIFFTFFYTAIIINPDELAENMRKSGGFVPGIRPGRRTADFFNYILTRLSLPGALYLALLAILPDLLTKLFHFPAMFSGTGLLIAVGVALDTSAQIESKLIEKRYEGFLTTGRMRGRR